MLKKFSISVDSNALRQYPSLDRLQQNRLYPTSILNIVINTLEGRPEGLRVELVYNVLKVTLRKVDREGNEDSLGLPRIEGHLRDLCDLIRETTSTDPRTQIYYSRKSSILQGSDLSDDALIAPNFIPAKGERKRHPLDYTSTEEVALRRRLANERWRRQKKEQSKRSASTGRKKIEAAKDFFDGKK